MSVRTERMWASCLIMVVVLLMAILVTAGCGSGVRTVPVMGVVTFNGKPPPHPCVVNFLPTGIELLNAPVEGGIHGRASGIGECDSIGAFRALCLKDRAGLMPGRYEVVVSCFVPNYTSSAPPVSVVPADFKAPDLVVPADARSVRYDLDVPANQKK